MPAQQEIIAALSNLPFAEDGNPEKQFSKRFWELVFAELRSFPISILAGNLFIQHSSDAAETIERRLQLFLALYKKPTNVTLAVLGEREYAHPHTQMIKDGLRKAGIRVLSGSTKHHFLPVRFKGNAKRNSKTVGIVGFSGKYAELSTFIPDESESLSSAAVASPAQTLETFLLEIEHRQDVDHVVVALPIPITTEIAAVCQRYEKRVIAVVSGAQSGEQPLPRSSGEPLQSHYQVAVPTPYELMTRGFDEIKPEHLYTVLTVPGIRR